MTKTILMAASALSLLAAPAFAQSTGGSTVVPVTGTVPNMCGQAPQSGGGVNAPTTSLALTSIVNTSGQLDTTQEHIINFGNFWCNGSATISMDVTKLATSAASYGDPGSFVKEVDMIVDNATPDGKSIFTYFGGPTSHRSSATPLTHTRSTAFETGTLGYASARVRLALPVGTSGNDRPVAGGYAGSITLTVASN